MAFIKFSKEVADQIRGEYGGKRLDPIQDIDGNFILNEDVFTEYNFSAVHEILEQCETVQSFEPLPHNPVEETPGVFDKVKNFFSNLFN